MSGSVVATGAETSSAGTAAVAMLPAYRGRLIWLIAPAPIFFVVFFVVPVGLLLAIGLNPMCRGDRLST